MPEKHDTPKKEKPFHTVFKAETLHKMLDPQPLVPGFQFKTLWEGKERTLEIVRQDEEGFLLKILPEEPVG